MDRQRREGLSSALREANIRQGGVRCSCENIVDAIWNVMEGELVHREVPELVGSGGKANRLLGVFIATIVSQLGRLVLIFMDGE